MAFIRINTLLTIGLLLLTSLAVIFTFLGLGYFAYPSADDFCMATGVRDNGLLPHLWDHYFEWSGRYAGNAMYAIFPLIFGLFSGIKLMPVVLVILLLAACAFFIAKLFNIKMFSIPVLLISLCFVAQFLLGMRHTASSLYWLAGALTYQSAHILLLFMLGLMFQFRTCQQQNSSCGGVLFILFLVVILGMGTNENNMIVVLTLLGATVFSLLRDGWSKLRPWFLLLIVALFCFAMVYFSPGNTIREATFPMRHNWLLAINGSLEMGWWSLRAWVGNPLFIITTLLVPFAAIKLNQLSTRFDTIPRSWIVLLAISCLSSPFVLQFPAWWSMGGWPPPRTVDAIYFVFLLNWCLLIGAFSIRYLPDKLIFSVEGQIKQQKVLPLLVVAMLFMFAVVVNSKFQRAHTDLWQRVIPFSAYIEDRHTLIEQAIVNKQPFLMVPAYNRDFPRSIFFNDIRKDYRDWRNGCYADFFGLQAIQLGR